MTPKYGDGRSLPVQGDHGQPHGSVGSPENEAGYPNAIVLSGAKGGVGTTVLTALLGAELARRGHRVMLVERADDGASLAGLLGAEPTGHLDDLLSGHTPPPQFLTVVRSNLWLFTVDPNARFYALDPVVRAQVQYRISNLYSWYDVVLIDAGASHADAVRACIVRATRLVVVTTPEPMALRAVRELVISVRLELGALPIGAVLNRVANGDQAAAAYHALAATCGNDVSGPIEWLGAIEEDTAIRVASRRERQLLQLVGPARVGIAALADYLVAPTHSKPQLGENEGV